MHKPYTIEQLEEMSSNELGHVLSIEAFKSSPDLDLVKLVIEFGAELNYKSQYGHYTSLHLAAMRGNITLVEILLRAGASKKIKDRIGKTPWDVASYHVEIYVPQLKPSYYKDLQGVSTPQGILGQQGI